ncbi:MAG: proline dehydrogenase, partial [Ignavibacteriaceae bacterium]|nr:proline dehydrogenase [Ignavibacteriaceae bacterium]
ELRYKIKSDGYKVRIYVPFGKDWYAYSIRRLKENPQIAGYVFKNIFSFGK